MTHSFIAGQNSYGKLQALGLDLPMLFDTDGLNLIGNIQNTLCIVLGNRIQNIQRIDSNAVLRVAEPNERIVKEYIKPLLVEDLLKGNQKGVARVHELIALEELLERLHYLDTELQVMTAMSVDQVTDMLSLAGRLCDDRAIVSEQVRHEESVEVLLVSARWLVVKIIVVDFPSQVLDHVHGVGETVIDWIQLLQEN
jgi:hypothetical protein